MKKLILPFLVMLAIAATAQTKTIKGQVHDKEGNYIPYAALIFKNGSTAYADKEGKFSFEANMGDTVSISAVGYNDFVQAVSRSQTLDVLLERNSNKTTDLDVKGKKQTGSNPATYSQFEKDQIAFTLNHIVSTSTSLPVIHQKDDTQGSPYLFNNWLKGYVINTNGIKIANDSYWLNFNKMSQNLLMTQDKVNAIEVDKASIKSFSLNNGGIEYVFENKELNKEQKLLQVLAKNDKYTLYKINSTKFERANYMSNGLTESGHNYDLYTDKPVYYLYSSATNQLKPVDLKKKSLKELFPKEQKKVDAYFSEHIDMLIDENFAIGLINSLD